MSHNIRKRLTNGISYNNTDPLVTLDIIINNLSKILSKLEIDYNTSLKLLTQNSKNLKKIQARQFDIEKEFTTLRLDLKTALVIPDEPYIRPAVDEIELKPQFSNGVKLKNLLNNNPLENQN